MLSYELNPKLMQLLVDLNHRFTEKNIFLESLPLETQDAIHRYARISMIGASTRIENAVLTDSEIGWLDDILGKDGKRTAFESNKSKIRNKLSKDKERSIEEVAGCRTMLYLIYEQTIDFNPLTESAIRGLHLELMRYDSRSGLLKGTYKRTPNKVVERDHSKKTEKVIFETADPGVVTETAMFELVKWYNDTVSSTPWTIAVACEFVFRFLAIHPFQDGNGRLGRALFLLCLLQSQQKSIANVSRYLAIDRQIERYKEEYYIILNQCSHGKFLPNPKGYKMGIFLHYMIKILNSALTDIEFYLKRHTAHLKLSESAAKILDCFKEKPEVKLTTGQICSETTIPRRTVVHALNQLLKNGFIQRMGQGAGTRYQLVF